ncbi:MAG: hypothetical protein WCL34_15285 [Methylococcaceae bacterium]
MACDALYEEQRPKLPAPVVDVGRFAALIALVEELEPIQKRIQLKEYAVRWLKRVLQLLKSRINK